MNYSHIRKMDKGQILGILKDIYPSAKLPSNIDVKISGDCLFINLKGKGVIANMQTDESAFEGWCIVLKAALPEIGSVILDWDSPAYIAGKENVQKAHYTRFLMRAAKWTNYSLCFTMEMWWSTIPRKTVARILTKIRNRRHISKGNWLIYGDKNALLRMNNSRRGSSEMALFQKPVL